MLVTLPRRRERHPWPAQAGALRHPASAQGNDHASRRRPDFPRRSSRPENSQTATQEHVYTRTHVTSRASRRSVVTTLAIAMSQIVPRHANDEPRGRTTTRLHDVPGAAARAREGACGRRFALSFACGSPALAATAGHRGVAALRGGFRRSRRRVTRFRAGLVEGHESLSEPRGGNELVVLGEAGARTLTPASASAGSCPAARRRRRCTGAAARAGRTTREGQRERPPGGGLSDETRTRSGQNVVRRPMLMLERS